MGNLAPVGEALTEGQNRSGEDGTNEMLERDTKSRPHREIVLNNEIRTLRIVNMVTTYHEAEEEYTRRVPEPSGFKYIHRERE